MPAGAAIEDEGVRFRLFAPIAERVQIALEGLDRPLNMASGSNGWHELTTPAASEGSLYRFILPDRTRVPDPVSRYQPKDVHGPSEVIDPATYVWHDGAWSGRPWTDVILYELHIGTFTNEGTFQAAREKLDYLTELGITAIELMCVSDFAGNRNWGYDGVLLYAPDSAYGRPEDLKSFVDAAHARKIMVILDVVYNHFGPEGNFIPKYFPQIWSTRHHTPWGKSLNFDEKYSSVVREFVVQNALYWIEEFHLDGLRLDASHTMVDDSPKHILQELHDRVQLLACTRPVHLILENEQNIEPQLRRDENGAVLSYTAQWNHDITHLLGAVFVELCDGDKWEETEKLAKALAQGFVIAEQERSNTWSCSVPPTAFVSFIQTHDLVGNRPRGDRVFADAPAEAIRAIVSIYLLLPQVPMLFMGEEWGASSPFPFFCDYHGQLADAVRKGRREQLAKLDPAPSVEELEHAPDPQALETFRTAQLKWSEICEEPHVAWLNFYRMVIKVRQEHVVPLLVGLFQSCGSPQVIKPGALAISWKLLGGAKLHLSANLCNKGQTGFPPLRGQLIWQVNLDNEVDEFSPWAVRWSIEKAASQEEEF
jgi:maltooligosyltrehalose trehalohydrolase